MEANIPPQQLCPVCHQTVKQENYFCGNCGANLRPKPPSTSIGKLTMLFLGSVFLPPLGIIWGLRYLKHKDSASKTVGTSLIVLTIIILFIVIKITVDVINTINEQIGSQLQNLEGF